MLVYNTLLFYLGRLLPIYIIPRIKRLRYTFIPPPKERIVNFCKHEFFSVSIGFEPKQRKFYLKRGFTNFKKCVIIKMLADETKKRSKKNE